MNARRNRAAKDALRHLADAARASIGVVSDTHGLVRPALLSAFEGCDVILHAGDVGAASVLKVTHADHRLARDRMRREAEALVEIGPPATPRFEDAGVLDGFPATVRRVVLTVISLIRRIPMARTFLLATPRQRTGEIPRRF